MRILYLFLISMIFPIYAYSQNLPHKFKDGDVIYADQINENFEYLQGVRETTVDCGISGNGNGINKAINEGYNSIIIKGFCKENLSIDGRSLNTHSLKLRGYNNDPSQDKILDASNNENYLISATYNSMFLKIDNLTLSGGKRGIYTWANVNLRITNTNFEKYTSVGLRLASGSTIYAENLKFNGSIESAETNQSGIQISGGSMAYFNGLTVENNMNNGIDIWQSGTWLSGTNLFESNDTGINIGTGSKLSFNKDSITTISESTIGLNSGQADVKLAGEITISNNTEKGINVNLSTFRTEESTKLEIQNIASGKAFSAYRSKLEIRNLTATGDGSTNNNLVEIGDGCSSDLRNIYVSNSGGDGIKFNNAESYIDNISSINNKKDGVNVWRSNVTIKNASITNNEDNGIEISQGSSSSLYSSTISSNQNEGVSAKRNSYLSLRNSEVKENLDVGVNISRNSYLDLMASSISSNQNSGIRVSKQSIIDFGGNDNDDPIIISNNTNVGLDVYGGVYIEFDDVNVEFQGNNGSINLGNDTHMNVGNSNLTVDQEINCWSLFSKDPNDETITQESEKPIIEFNYTTDLPQVSSNCRIKTSEN